MPCLFLLPRLTRWALGIAALALATGCVPQEKAGQRLRFAIWGTRRQAAIEQSIARAFEAAHPGVTVEVLYFGAGYQEKIQSMIVGDSLPDVIMVDSMVYGDWGSRGALMNVSDLVADLDRDSPFLPVAREVFSLRGAYYGVPVNAQTLVMYCNLDALRRAGIVLPAQGWTWEEFAALGPRLARHAGNPAAPTDYLCVAPAAPALLLGFGATLFDDPHRPDHVVLDGPNAAAAVQFQRRLVGEGWAAPADTVRDAGFAQLFRDGRVAFLFAGRYVSSEFREITAFAWDIVPAPRNPGGTVEAGGTALAIAQRTRVPELAREFVRFYASDLAVNLAARGGRIVPVRHRLAYSPEFLALQPPPSVALFSRSLEAGAGGAYLYTAGAREVYDLLYKRLEQAAAEPDLPAEEIVRLMRRDLERWLGRAKQKGGP